MTSFVSPALLRRAFTRSLADMYAREVPEFTKLQRLVSRINESGPAYARVPDPLLPRHGAIRQASHADLADTARVLAVMGTRPVGYYDLDPTGIPIHATCFRSTSSTDLEVSPLRLFVSVVRPEVGRQSSLIGEILEQRKPMGSFFGERMMQLVGEAESRGGVLERDGAKLATLACKAFSWTGVVDGPGVGREGYLALKAEKSGDLLADVLSFANPHLNHLTPATGDIDSVQGGMAGEGLVPKERVEGPPRRTCPLLLRQTSFKAVEEDIAFPDEGGTKTGRHTARFGEVEQRGAALTRKGRDRYDKILDEATRRGLLQGQGAEDAYKHLFDASFPDGWEDLREEGLIWVKYALTQRGQAEHTSEYRKTGMSMKEEALREGLVSWSPIVYEDFLPMSAAGIFQSNLGERKDRPAEERAPKGDESKKTILAAVGGEGILDELGMYATQEEESLGACLEALGIS